MLAAAPAGTLVSVAIQFAPGLVEPETLEWTRAAGLGILGYGLLAGVVAAALAFGYRAATVRKPALGSTVVAGLAAPAVWLAVDLWRRGTVVADSSLTHHSSGAYLLGVVASGTLLGAAGHRLGDHLARGAFDVARLEADGEIADRVRSAGLAVEITLPETIDDAAGYPRVGTDVERTLEGRSLLLPQGLSLAERRERIRRRLETDFDLGYVRADLRDDGTVESLAIGGRRAGISATLPPERVAVAIRADCAPGVSVGDPIEVWTAESDSSRLVATGRLRASSGAVTTLVVDEGDADAFESDVRYRLTTRPASPSDAGALVAAIRSADEAVTTVTVEAGGPLESEFVGWVPGTVLAIDRDGAVLARPADNEPLRADDTLSVFGPPARLDDLRTRSVGGSVVDSR